MRARIKRGAEIMHDFFISTWPYALPMDIEHDPDTIFEAQWLGRCWKCIAPGYGKYGCYGNGPIFVYGEDSVEPVDNC